jgi:hypothetical protein
VQWVSPFLDCKRGEKTIKLNLLFIAMEVLTVLAYPVMFVYTLLRHFSKFRQDIVVAKLLVISPITPGK